MLTRDDIIELLTMLNDKLRDSEIDGQVYIVGGAALVLAHSARQSTKDIDAVFMPTGAMREMITKIAVEAGVPDDWLNDAAKGYVNPESMSFEEVETLSNLTVYTADAKSLLAMKLTSARTDDESTDVKDAVFLAKKCGVTSLGELYDIAETYSYANQLTAKSSLFIQFVANLLESNAGISEG